MSYTLHQKRDLILSSLRTQCRARLKSAVIGDIHGRVDQVAVVQGDEELHPRLDAFLRDCANNSAQALADEDDYDEPAGLGDSGGRLASPSEGSAAESQAKFKGVTQW